MNSTRQKINVGILASRPMVKAALRAVIAEASDLESVAEATTQLQLDRVLGTRPPDVLLIDDADPGWETLGVVRRVRESGVRLAGVVILTDLAVLEHTLEYLRAGADALVLNDATLEEIATAIRAVSAGHAVVPPPLARQLIDLMVRRVPALRDTARLAALTSREQEIFELISAGMSNREVAQSLVLSEKTVKFHVSNLLRKLGLRNRTQAIVYARDGILPLGG